MNSSGTDHPVGDGPQTWVISQPQPMYRHSSSTREQDDDELRHRLAATSSNGNESDSPLLENDDEDKSSSSTTSLERAPSALRAPGAWRAVPHCALPDWLQDNDYLVKGHRPPLQSTVECLRSIFRIHTETVNIWTHLLGALIFVYFAIFFCFHGPGDGNLSNREFFGDKMVFLVFFAAAIMCMNLSWFFHAMCCHSSDISLLCVKLDYCGIAMLIVGSMVPWLYFGFYCSFFAKWLYVSTIVVLGAATVTVSLWDRFSRPQWRPVRAGLFVGLAISGVVPATHYSLLEGVVRAFTSGGIGWLLLMGAIFVLGASLYAFRVPERFFPGKCDIVFQSHQIFHVCVVVGCYVEYHGICQLSEYIRSRGDCPQV